MSNNIYILYHASCTDGTGAKYAAWKKFGDRAEYIPVQYGKPVPEMKPGSRVFILDFSYPRNVIEELQSAHREVVILDHHLTAREALRGVKGCVFDMNKSGAVLAWEYFHPGKPVPRLLVNIQDRDLWKFKEAFSKEVHAGLQLSLGNMELWDYYAEDEGYGILVENGGILIRRMEIEVKNSLKKVRKIKFQGHRVGVINTTEYMSEIGNAICESKDLNVDFAICYGITNENQVLLSLRSIGDFDVSEIAKKFGGGGHKNASGAKITLEELTFMLRNGLA